MDTTRKTPEVTVADDGSIVIRPAPMAAPDELIVFPFGFEAEGARTLIRNNTLRTAKIGRKRYAKRSDLLALVDRLADEEAAARATKPATNDDAAAGYAKLVAKSARKGGGK
jgi:hypothetical protein